MQDTTCVEHPYTTTSWKVHSLACSEVKNITEKITNISTALDSARPRCDSGLQALCSLYKCIERCESLFLHCSESSKLYLAISGEKIILRCERICYSLELCLSQLQNMVEPTLAAKISQIVDYIRSVVFSLDSSEDEAGKMLLALLHLDIKASNHSQHEELKAFNFAACRLHMTSSLALLIEKRSLRKLLRNTCDTDPAKNKILKYLLYLVVKYGKPNKQEGTESMENVEDDVFYSVEAPVRFKYRNLRALSCSSSVCSFNSSLGDLNLQVDNVSVVSMDGFGEIQETSMGQNLFVLGNLSDHPRAVRCKAVEEVKNQLKDYQESPLFTSAGYINPVFKFLKEAHQLGDSEARRHGVELLLLLVKECRTDVPPLQKGTMSDILLFLDSDITEEAFLLLEVLSYHEHYTREMLTSGILLFFQQVIQDPKSKHHNLVLRVLCNLSAHANLAHHMIYLRFIQDLVPFLDNFLLSSYCLRTFVNLCAIDEAAAHFLENETCIASIEEFLELGKAAEQEHALEILISLCYQREEAREVLMRGGIVSNLVQLSGNGSCEGKLKAVELLQLLSNVADDHSQVCRLSNTSGSIDGNLKTSPKSSVSLFDRIKSKFRKFKYIW